MKIFHQNGSKERLFEMMHKVNGVVLNEEILSVKDKQQIVNDFVSFVNKRIDFKDNIPNIKLSYDEDVAQEMKSFGRYMPETNEIIVVAKNRNLADILRTIAHELVHQKQKKDNKLNQNSGETGSPEENEANALAGVLMRDFAQNNPQIFE